MLRLTIGNSIYIKSDQDIAVTIDGFVTVLGVRTAKRLYEYIVRQNTTRLVYVADAVTDVSVISTTGSDTGTTIGVYLNGTDVGDQVYEITSYNTYNILYDSRGWINNNFVPPVPTTNTNDGNDYFP